MEPSSHHDPYAALDGRLNGHAADGDAAHRWAAAALLFAVLLTISRALLLTLYSYSRLSGVVTVFAVIVAVVDVACAALLWRGVKVARAITLFRALAGLTFGLALIVFADGWLVDKIVAIVMQFALCITLFLLLLGAPGRWWIIVALALFLVGFALPITFKTVADLYEPFSAERISEWIDGPDDDALDTTASPEGSTYTREGLEYGRFEHCDADGCIAVDMPVEGAEDGDVSLWAEGEDWIMSATLYALDEATLASSDLWQESLAFCADWLVESGEISSYYIESSDVGAERATYELDVIGTWGAWGKGVALVYFEIDGSQLIELCIYGPDNSELRDVFQRAIQTVEVTAGPDPYVDDDLATPIPNSTYTQDGFTFGRFEHCDADGCVAADLPVVGAEDGSSSLWSLGDEGDGAGSAWMLAVTCYALAPFDANDPHLIPEAFEACVDWWLDGEAFDTWELVDSGVDDTTGLYQLAIDGVDGEGVALVYFELAGEQLVEVATFGPASDDLVATFARACETVEVTAPPDPIESDYATPEPGSETRDGDITYGWFEHCDVDGCFTVELPADITIDDEGSLGCGQEDWLLSALILADVGTPGAPDPSLEAVVELAIEGWYEADGVESVFDEQVAQGDDWISYEAGCADALSDNGQCWVWAQLDDGRIKVIWAVSYDPGVDVGAIVAHAKATFVITE